MREIKRQFIIHTLWIYPYLLFGSYGGSSVINNTMLWLHFNYNYNCVIFITGELNVNISVQKLVQILT